MPCQCGTTAVSEGTETAYGSGVPTPSDVASNLERFVMELDKRVRKLEASR